MNQSALLRWLGRALIVALFLLLGRELARQWEALGDYDWQVRVIPTVLSLVLVLAAYALSAEAWRRIILGFGRTISVRRAFVITFVSNLGRYLPGRVWQAVSVMEMARRDGVTRPEAVSSFVISQVFVMLASVIVIALTLWANPDLLPRAVAEWMIVPLLVFAALVAILAMTFVLRPAFAYGLINRLLARFGREPIAITLSPRAALGVIALYTLFWIIHGAAFAIFLRAMTPDGVATPNVFVATGIFALAHQLGYIAIFAPGGIGVRETALSIMLMPYFGELAVPLALMSRIWATVAEGMAALVALLVKYWDSRTRN